jgi:hypothetical protein
MWFCPGVIDEREPSILGHDGRNRNLLQVQRRFCVACKLSGPATRW